MPWKRSRGRLLAGALLAAATAAAPAAVTGRAVVPAPAEILGAEPCADYTLATYEAIDEYFRALAAASDRVRLLEIGRSVEGRPLRLAIISSERNLRNLDRYRRIARTLALARVDSRALQEPAARELAAEGRAVVWVDFGLHSSEVAHAQAAPLFAWRVATGESAELRRIRDDVILLLMPNMNPDGTTQVADWYMRHRGTPFEASRPPELYHRYVGHDNNRDWFMLTMPESQAVARQLYHEWFPQILHNQHQEAPFPARIFVPPFEDPVNPRIPPLVVRGINTVGDAITRRLEQEGKTGAVSRVQFDAWWNGGMRTAPYFHNMIGILTETAHASPAPAEYDAGDFPPTFSTGVSTREPSTYYPSPYRGGRWTQRDSCEYMLTASMAVLDIASRRRQEWLFDAYRMARAAIRAGAQEAYVVPARAQWDPPTAARLVNTLLRGGIEVDQAEDAFRAGGRSYEAGSWLIPGGQPFRAYLGDLLEPQDYPDLRLYPGGPPDRPYDVTGWTLPIQMGVRVDRLDEVPDVKRRRVELARPPAGRLIPASVPAVWALDPRVNNSVRAVNRVLHAGLAVARLTEPLGSGKDAWPPGAFLVPAGATADALLEDAAAELALQVRGLDDWPDGRRVTLAAVRLALYRPWGGSIDEGWTRWILEQFEFPYETLRDADVRAGGLAERFDVIVLPDVGYESLLTGVAPGRLPEKYTGGLTPRGVAQLYEFAAAGGTLITLDSASELPLTAFGLPIRNVLENVEETEFYIPGSLLRLTVDPADPLGWGIPSDAPAFFAHGLAFSRPRRSGRRGPADAEAGPPPGVRVAARYAETDILLSGWELGGAQLAGRGAVVEAEVERGRVVLIGFRAQHRAQPHATFKFLFNAVFRGAPGR